MAMNRPHPDDVTPAELAKTLGRDPESVRSAIKRGAIAARRVRVEHFEYRIPASEAERVIALGSKSAD